MGRLSIICGVLILSVLAPLVRAEVLIYRPNAELEEDKRRDYFDALLALALDKTRPSHGDYELRAGPKIEWRRLLKQMKDNQYPNMVVAQPYSDEFGASINADYIAYPIDRGLLSYRICFVNAAVKTQVAQAKTLEQLRQFTIAQGTGWQDVAVLRNNGFTVLEFESYPSLFKMVIGGRADLYCRGLNELKNEYETYKGLGKLEYDQSFVLHYAVPWFFYVSNNNRALHQRISEGLALAHGDGSLEQLWLDYFKSSIEFAQLSQRQLHQLESNQFNRLGEHYQTYLADPFAF